MSNSEPAVSGWPLVVGGIAFSLLGLLLVSISPEDTPGPWIGYALTIVGGVVASVGTIAAGVTMGIIRAQDIEKRDSISTQ